MNKPEKELEDIKKRYRPQIERLNKMMLNMHSIANIRYWYWCLSHFRKSPNLHEDIMQMDALTASIVMSYGRLFGKSTGTTVLSKDMIPDIFKEVHQSIIDLRHGRYAHHGLDKTTEKNIGVEFNGSSFVVSLRMEISMCLGAPQEWAPLFKLLDEFMYESVQKVLSHLTSATGVNWEILSDEAPFWTNS